MCAIRPSASTLLNARRVRLAACVVAVFVTAVLVTAVVDRPAAADDAAIAVDADFPGGNIVVDSIDGRAVRLHQDLRDTAGDWFYWAFRTQGAAGRTLRFEFTGSNPIGALGPAMSIDGGRSWRWLGRDSVDGKAFAATIPAGAGDVRFALAPLYTEANLEAFLARHDGSPYLIREVLCRSAAGREIERLHVGRLDREPAHRLLLVARHHACETMASYAMEGILDEVLADSEDGRWLRQHVEILAVPFMDKDGVEQGDQGKNRRPHDHNRDYVQEIYPSVRALKALVPTWSAGRLRLALDMHGPWIRGGQNEQIHFPASRDPKMARQLDVFSQILQRMADDGPLPYRAADNIPFGKLYNKGTGDPKLMASRAWTSTRPGIRLAATIEIPYARARGAAVTPETARAFGRDLARAMREYLEGSEATRGTSDAPEEASAVVNRFE